MKTIGWLEVSEESHVHIISHSYCKSITWPRDIESNCNCGVEVHNYKVYTTIKVTAGGENYDYNYCTRKAVIITLLIIMVIQLRQH